MKSTKTFLFCFIYEAFAGSTFPKLTFGAYNVFDGPWPPYKTHYLFCMQESNVKWWSSSYLL